MKLSTFHLGRILYPPNPGLIYSYPFHAVNHTDYK